MQEEGPSALVLEGYRALVALDEPFVRPAAVSGTERVALLTRVLAHLASDGTADRLRAGAPSWKPAEPRAWLRALLTVRPPELLPDDVQLALDRLLWTEALARPRIDARDLPPLEGARGALRVGALWQGDIAMLAADAIVNAANSALLGCFRPFHACIDNAIHAAAGPRLREDCARIMRVQDAPEPAGLAKATRAYNLPARFVLHTVGPIVDGALRPAHELALAACYRACLDTAIHLDGVRSVALCAVSTGVFGFPREPAAVIAVRTVGAWLAEHPGMLDRVVFNVFADADRRAYERALASDGGAS